MLKVKDLSVSIETLAKKAEGLIKAYASAREQIDSLESDNRRLQEKVEKLTGEMQQLKEENQVLKMASALKGDQENVTEAKRRISQMVREIDRCIAMLND